MKHIETNGELPLTTFRKIALGTWVHPRDPQIYAEVELNAEPALRFLDQQKQDRPLSITHYVAKIFGDCFARYPDLNSVILRGKLYRRNEISVFISTLLKNKKGADLSGFCIRNIDQLSLDEIVKICENELKRLRRGDDPEFHALDKYLSRIPMPLVSPPFRIMNFLKFDLNRSTRMPGMQADRFGSMIITNIAALGLQSAFPPLTPVSRTPYLVAIGKPFEGVVVANGEICIQKRIKIGFTIDHRYLDGFHGSKILRYFTKVFEAPDKHVSVFCPGSKKEHCEPAE